MKENLLPSEIYQNASDAHCFTPWCIQDITDAENRLVKKIKDLELRLKKNSFKRIKIKESMGTYKGKQIDSFTKEELIEIVIDLGSMYNDILMSERNLLIK